MLFKLNGLHNSYAVLRVRLKGKHVIARPVKKKGMLKFVEVTLISCFLQALRLIPPFLFIWFILVNSVAEKLMLLL